MRKRFKRKCSECTKECFRLKSLKLFWRHNNDSRRQNSCSIKPSHKSYQGCKEVCTILRKTHTWTHTALLTISDCVCLPFEWFRVSLHVRSRHDIPNWYAIKSRRDDDVSAAPINFLFYDELMMPSENDDAYMQSSIEDWNQETHINTHWVYDVFLRPSPSKRCFLNPCPVKCRHDHHVIARQVYKQ